MISLTKHIIFAQSNTMSVPPLTGPPLYRYIPGVGRAVAVECTGPGVAPLFGSFLSSTTQSVGTTNPAAITYSERTIGSINVSNGTYPNSQIRIPTTGIYRVMFSAQCDSTSGTHELELFPVVNGTSVPDSNTRVRITAGVETCLTAEYFLSFVAGDILQLYMIGGSTNAKIVAISRSGGTPAVPNIPSIIVTIQRIG